MQNDSIVVQQDITLLDKDGNVNFEKIPTSEIENYKAIAAQLNETDQNAVLNYGADVQNEIAKQSDTFLTSVRSYNSGEIGELINGLLGELSYINIDDLNQTGLRKILGAIPLLNKLVLNVEKIFQRYDKISVTVEKIANKVKVGMTNSLKDNTSLQIIFDSNVGLIKEMEKYIIAGQMKYKEVQEELATMEAHVAQYQDYQIADKRDFVNRLDKRLADLKIVRYILLQSLPQIRVVQNNNTAIAEKAQTILTTTMPVWKNQLTLAVALQRQKQHVEVQKKVADTTNTILKKNAEMLKQNSIDVARESENTVVSLEILKTTTKSLIDTLTEVKQIHVQGAEMRRQLDSGLQHLETELRKGIRG